MDFVIFLTLQFFFLFLFSPTTSSAPLLVTTALVRPDPLFCRYGPGQSYSFIYFSCIGGLLAYIRLKIYQHFTFYPFASMDDIDVRIHKLSNRLASDPYQIPENTQYITFLPNSEREISPIPESRGFSFSQRYESSTSPSPSGYNKQSASPSSPAHSNTRSAPPAAGAKRVNSIFTSMKKKPASVSNSGGKTLRQTSQSKSFPATDHTKLSGGGKKTSSIFLTNSRHTKHHRSVSPAGKSAGVGAFASASDLSDSKGSIPPVLKQKRYVYIQEIIETID